MNLVSYRLSINEQGHDFQGWEEEISVAQFDEGRSGLNGFRSAEGEALVRLKREMSNSSSVYSRVSPLLVPLRTNRLKNLMEDLFFPTIVHHAMKVQEIGAKILAIVATFFVDLFTLPIRLVTCIPRIIYQVRQPKHPLIQAMRDSERAIEHFGLSRIPEELLHADVLETEITEIYSYGVDTSEKRTSLRTIYLVPRPGV